MLAIPGTLKDEIVLVLKVLNQFIVLNVKFQIQEQFLKYSNNSARKLIMPFF